ncbi:MAG TPA: OsmC family protein [Candidatus Cloacimonadota bacterium]|nr:OsmC family protein [Candidatus Cloacimonadota bacterium]
MTMKKVEVSGKLNNRYEVQVSAREFTFVTDQGKPMGNNAGPSPVEYLLFGFAGCLGTVARMVALEKKIDLNAFTVKIEGELDVDVFMGKSKENRPGFLGLKVILDIDAPISHEEKVAMMHEIDARCPISDNLLNPTPIEFIVN